MPTVSFGSELHCTKNQILSEQLAAELVVFGPRASLQVLTLQAIDPIRWRRPQHERTADTWAWSCSTLLVLWQPPHGPKASTKVSGACVQLLLFTGQNRTPETWHRNCISAACELGRIFAGQTISWVHVGTPRYLACNKLGCCFPNCPAQQAPLPVAVRALRGPLGLPLVLTLPKLR